MILLDVALGEIECRGYDGDNLLFTFSSLAHEERPFEYRHVFGDRGKGKGIW